MTGFAPGDRVVAFHHIPCLDCFYCDRKLYAQCPVYKKVGITAGFEPAGGGFAQYVRVMDWIVERRRGEDSRRRLVRAGVACGAAEHLSEGRGAVRSAARTISCVVLGQGPIGLMFTMLRAAHGRTRGCHRYDCRRGWR